jgi:hypothetical protein
MYVASLRHLSLKYNHFLNLSYHLIVAPQLSEDHAGRETGEAVLSPTTICMMPVQSVCRSYLTTHQTVTASNHCCICRPWLFSTAYLLSPDYFPPLNMPPHSMHAPTQNVCTEAGILINIL